MQEHKTPAASEIAEDAEMLANQFTLDMKKRDELDDLLLLRACFKSPSWPW